MIVLLLAVAAAVLLWTAGVVLWAAHRAPVTPLDESLTRADAPSPRPYRRAA